MNCPAFGKKCRICGKPNHFKAICYSRDRACSASSGKGKSPLKRKKGKKPFGKKPKFQADSFILQQMVSKGGNSVPSAATNTDDAVNETQKTVLSGPPPEAAHSTMNAFSCCEITSRLDGSSTVQNQVYTDTNPEGRLAIYTDMLVKASKAAKTNTMEVKVDPGTEGTLFIQNIQTRRYRPIRFYVIDRESGPVLLGHTACYWLSMITVQCFNKAKRHKKLHWYCIGIKRRS